MFNFAEFVIVNLCNGFDNGTFREEQVNIFAMNYLIKAIITQEDFEYIQNHMNPKEETTED